MKLVLSSNNFCEIPSNMWEWWHSTKGNTISKQWQSLSVTVWVCFIDFLLFIFSTIPLLCSCFNDPASSFCSQTEPDVFKDKNKSWYLGSTSPCRWSTGHPPNSISKLKSPTLRVKLFTNVVLLRSIFMNSTVRTQLVKTAFCIYINWMCNWKQLTLLQLFSLQLYKLGLCFISSP